VRWFEGRELRQLAGDWQQGRRRVALDALATRFPDDSPQAATRDLIAKLEGHERKTRADPEALTAAMARRELRDLSAFHKVDQLDEGACLEHVRTTVEHAEHHPALRWLASEGRELLASTEEETPLKVAILGSFSTGKSSLVNAVLGSEVLPTGLVPVTASLTVIRWGKEAAATIVFHDGERRQIPLDELVEFTDQRVDEGAAAREVDRVEVAVPVPFLQRITLYDTPGFDSGFELHELVTERVINQADAVLWVFDITKLGSEVERQEIAHIRRATGKAVALVNKIDKFERRRYERKPERWQKKLQGVLDEVREQTEFGKLIDHWVPVSAHWIDQQHTQGGVERLEAVLDQFQERKEQIQAEARLRHLREAARRGLALAQIVVREEQSEQADRDAWVEKCRRWAAELRADWQDEIRLARRRPVPPPPQCSGEPRSGRRLARDLIPQLTKGFGNGGSTGVYEWRGQALEAWSALDGLAAVLAAGDRFGAVWETALLRARDLESKEPKPVCRWRVPAKRRPGERSGSLVDLLLIGDGALERGVDAWLEGDTSEPDVHSPGPSGHWSEPGLEPSDGIEGLLGCVPCSQELISEVWHRRELRLVQRASRQLFVRPVERWAAVLGFLRPRGPLELAVDPKTIQRMQQVEQDLFESLPKRTRKHAAVERVRKAWRTAGRSRTPPPLPDAEDTSLPGRVRRLFTGLRPGLEAAIEWRLQGHVSHLQRRSWWALGRVTVWASLLCFLGAFAHVEAKEWLDFDVARAEDRRVLAMAAVDRMGAGEWTFPELPDLPDLPEDGALAGWFEGAWARMAEALDEFSDAGDLAPVLVEDDDPPTLDEQVMSPLEKLESECNQGEPSSCASLGRLFLTGGDGFEADDRSAERVLAKACRLGDDDGPCIQAGVLAKAREDGHGRVEAIDLFTLACDRGSIDGCVQAADTHLMEGGSRSSTAEACTLLATGCESSHRGACERLGVLVTGRDAGQCPDAAIESLRIACLGGQDDVCWPVAQGMGCTQGVTGSDCWLVMQRACEGGVLEACGEG
jgi:GTPase Era involved in 16S rRNA processing